MTVRLAGEPTVGEAVAVLPVVVTMATVGGRGRTDAERDGDHDESHKREHLPQHPDHLL
jgi:hypothetical protein